MRRSREERRELHRRFRGGALIFCALAAALSACTPRDQWIKESASAAEFRRDLDWCHALGYQERSYLDDRYYFLADTVELRTFDACMRERGYRREAVPGGE